MQKPEHEDALILRTEASGESFLKLHVLTAQSGVFLCLKRISKKATHTPQPDLFDSATLLLEHSQHGTARFVKDYQLIQRREGIGRSYRSLQCAARLANLLIANGAHMPEPEALYALTARALEALAAGKAPTVVLLKSFYIILKDEGYPVSESWWPSLPLEEREAARSFINQPTSTQITAETQRSSETVLKHLTDWMRQSTDLIVPEEN